MAYMDALTGVLAVLAIGLVAGMLYGLKIIAQAAKDSVEAARQMAESNTVALTTTMKESVEGIMAAFQPSKTVEQPVEGVPFIQTTNPDENVPWSDWTLDEYPDAGRPDIIGIRPGEDVVPGIPRPDLSGEEYGL